MLEVGSMKIDYQNARKLCNPTELSLLEDTKPKTLTGFTDAELKKKVTQARKYSDKWRQQAISQGNSTNGNGERSQQKHELFKEALDRFEGRLARTATPAKKAPQAPQISTKAAPVKAVAKKTAKKTAKKVPAKKATKSPSPPEAPHKGGPIIPLTRKAEQKALGTDMRMAASGLTTRVRGHVSAQGRRDQAARSSRKRSKKNLEPEATNRHRPHVRFYLVVIQAGLLPPAFRIWSKVPSMSCFPCSPML